MKSSLIIGMLHESCLVEQIISLDNEAANMSVQGSYVEERKLHLSQDEPLHDADSILC